MVQIKLFKNPAGRILLVTMSEDNYTQVLLEDINSKFDAVQEAVAPMKQLMADNTALRSDAEEVKADVKIIKAAVTDLSHQVNDIDKRTNRLESLVG